MFMMMVFHLTLYLPVCGIGICMSIDLIFKFHEFVPDS
jgi:hypothetical protein